MEDKEDIQSKIDELTIERNKILRGFGGRYSYTHRLKSDPDLNKHKIKDGNKRIKNVKGRLIKISDEIQDLQIKLKEIERDEIKNIKSSKNFNSLYKESITLFD